MKFLLLTILLATQASATDWQGHRGARGLYPENTIEGMKEALKFPVSTLELDVIISGDKQVVVSHEPWMNGEICKDPQGKEIKGEKFNLYKMPYSEIQKFDCGSKVHPRFPDQKKAVVGKPLLTKLIAEIEPELKRLKRYNVSYNIEIKSTPEDEKRGYQPNYKEFADIVIHTVRQSLAESRFTIQSFDWRVLKYIHSRYPEVQLVALREEPFEPEAVLKELGFTPAVFSPYFQLLNKDIVCFFHNKGIKVIPWTVNSVKDMNYLRSIDVAGIITDYPNLIEEVMGKGCKEGQHLFEGKCVQIPKDAIPSSKAPGWDCSPGFVQKRLHCEQIKIPKNGRLTSDGKNWECLPGFERYRSSCKKL